LILDFISSIDAPRTIPVWTITGKLAWKQYDLRIDCSAVTLDTPSAMGIHVRGSFGTGLESVISIENGNIGIF
jgi:hypothetical protein